MLLREANKISQLLNKSTVSRRSTVLGKSGGDEGKELGLTCSSVFDDGLKSKQVVIIDLYLLGG